MLETSPEPFRNLAAPADQAKGAFEIQGIPPGSYDLIVLTPAPPIGSLNASNLLMGRTAIDVGTSDRESVEIDVKPGVAVRVSVAADGLADSTRSIRPVLRSRENHPLAFEMAMLRPGESLGRPRAGEAAPPSPSLTDATGAFVFAAVAPGTYALSLSGLPESVYVRDIRQGESSLRAGIVAVGDSTIELTVELAAGGAVVSGDVYANSKSVMPKATVLLVPADEGRQNEMLVKRVEADAEGRFTFVGVAPGDYFVYAADRVPVNAHLNLEFLSAIQNRGQAVRVSSADAKLDLAVSGENVPARE